MSYRVSIPSYSGPFDLLLQLVSRQKVDIGAISVSEIADQYLAETEQLEDMDLEVASDFYLVAATLLDIKAASLLPEDEPRSARAMDDDEDDEYAGLDADSMREVLIQRLIAYKQIRSAAAALGARMEAESHMHPRTAGPDPEFLGLMPDYLAGVTLRGLAVICADLDSRHETFLLEAEHVAPHRVPLELTIASVDRATIARPHLEFSDLVEDDAPAEQVVASFLAILELSKRGSVTLAQEEAFGPIAIDRVPGAPAYEPEGDGETYEAAPGEGDGGVPPATDDEATDPADLPLTTGDAASSSAAPDDTAGAVDETDEADDTADGPATGAPAPTGTQGGMA